MNLTEARDHLAKYTDGRLTAIDPDLREAVVVTLAGDTDKTIARWMKLVSLGHDLCNPMLTDGTLGPHAGTEG